MSNQQRPFGGTQVMNPMPAPQVHQPAAAPPQPAPQQPQHPPAGPPQQGWQQPPYAPPAQQYAPPAQQYAPPAQQYAPPGQQYAPQQHAAPPQQGWPQQYAAPPPHNPQQHAPQQYAPPQQAPQQYAPPAQQYAPPAQQHMPQQYAAPGQQQAPQQYAPPAQQYAPPAQQYAPPAQQHMPQQYAAPGQQQAPQQYAPPAQQYAPPGAAPAAPYTPPAAELAAPAAAIPVEAGFMAAVRLNFKMLGYALPSFAYSTALSAVSFAIVAGTLGLSVVAFMYIHKYVAGAMLLLGFVPLVLFWVPFTWRKMFSMTAGHVAVMTELATTGALQRGSSGMFKYGRGVIATRFGDREGFRAFHNRLENMLGHLMKTIDRLDDYIPPLRVVRPYLSRLRGLLMRHIQWVVLSYAVSRQASGEEQLKQRSMEATCYVVQNGMGLLKTALIVSVLERLSERVMWFVLAVTFTFGVFAGVYTLGYDLPLPDFSHFDMSMLQGLLGNEALWVSLVAAVLVGPLTGYLVTSAYVEAVLRPFATSMVVLKFHKLIEGQALKPEWAARIRAGDSASDRMDWLSFKSMGVG